MATWAKRVRRAGLVAAGAFAVLAAVLIGDGWRSFGEAAVGQRKLRMERSPQWGDGVFVNPQPLWNDWAGSMGSLLRASPVTTPDAPLPVVRGDRSRFAAPPSSGLRVTWLGHSTQLIEIDGKRVLTDPIFGARASPYSWVGPARWYPPPIPLAELPAVDAVILSHDHYDHLQRETIEQIADWDTLFVAPLGVGAHLEYWGVPADRIVELDWWERTSIGDVEIVCTPARHASGRQVLDQNATLWAGYALVGPKHRAFFSGDTGLFDAMKDIGDKLGPFDVTMIEIGAYDPAWPDWHIGPEQAVQAHQMLRGKTMLGVHWGLWSLASHGWTEPAERVVLAAQSAGVVLAVPKPGQSIEPTTPPPLERWWPSLPWRTAAETPVVSTRDGHR